MTLKSQCALISALAILAGCQPPSKEQSKDGWDDAKAIENTAPAAATPAQSSQVASAPVVDDGSLIVKGSAFKLEGTSETLQVSGDTLRMGHYFFAVAPFELKTTATAMISDLEGQNAKGAVPLIGLRVTSTQGKYQDFAMPERPIDGAQSLTDPINIGPGTYKVTINYFKDTGNGGRPWITLKQIQFK